MPVETTAKTNAPSKAGSRRRTAVHQVFIGSSIGVRPWPGYPDLAVELGFAETELAL
jgi:hypothetical protein